MHKTLQAIIAKTKEDLQKRKSSRLTLFARTIKNVPFAIIAEIKFASPSEGVLGSQKDFLKRIKEYEKAGVDCVSIVTEKHFFKGDPVFVQKAKKATSLPVLQKDFVVDPYQIYKAKQAGADAILLIARIVAKKELIGFVDFAHKFQIEPVVEVHNESDLANALATKTRIIAVNARDLDTFTIDVDRACQLLKKIDSKFIKLGFSGIASKKEVEQYKKAGADGVLIGTSLMRAKNVGKFLLSLRAHSTSSVRSNLKILDKQFDCPELIAEGPE